jgi:hypothetical protein
VYRDNQIYTCHTVEVDDGSRNFRAACRVFSIDTSSLEKRIDVAVGRTDSFYFKPALNVAADGSVLVVCNMSNASRYAEIRYFVRFPGDETFQPSRLLKSGEAPYVHVFGGRNRRLQRRGSRPDGQFYLLVQCNVRRRRKVRAV